MERLHLGPGPLVHEDDHGGRLTLYTGGLVAPYLAEVARNGAQDELLVLNPQGSRLRVRSSHGSYELEGPGTVLVSKGTSPELSYELEGPEAPLAAEVRPPGWWRPYEGPSRNPTGYEGDAEVGTYDLGERRSAESGGPTEWTNDSVSSRPEGALGVHGFSYMRNRVRGEGGPADMLPIYENRPEECVHRHPRVSGYERGSEVEGLSELYVVGSGKVGIGVFHPEEGTMDYHLLAQGDALVIGPDEVHAVLATSREFSYSCLQAPSLYHYPFNYTKHQFARVDEVDALLGRHLVGGLASIEEPGVYRLEADARALGVR